MKKQTYPGVYHFLAGRSENKRGNPTMQLTQHFPDPSSPGRDTWSRLHNGSVEDFAGDRKEGWRELWIISTEPKSPATVSLPLSQRCPTLQYLLNITQPGPAQERSKGRRKHLVLLLPMAEDTRGGTPKGTPRMKHDFPSINGYISRHKEAKENDQMQV